jgi:UrcA family protein
MKRISNAAFAAIVVVCVAPFATPVAAQDREQVSARVVYGDLNLAVSAGRSTFERRVRTVADRLCAADTRDLGMMRDAYRCHGEMIESGRQQLATLRARPQVQVGSKEPAAAVIIASK